MKQQYETTKRVAQLTFFSLLVLFSDLPLLAQMNEQPEVNADAVENAENTSEDFTSPVAEDVPAHPSQEQSGRDSTDYDQLTLITQERMAEAAETSVKLTERQTRLSFLEAILLFIGVLAAAAAAVYARNAAISARRNLSILQDGQQAWVGIEDWTITRYQTAKMVVRIAVNPRLVNRGLTPAFAVKPVGTIEVCSNTSTKDTAEFSNDPPPKHWQGYSILPQCSMEACINDGWPIEHFLTSENYFLYRCRVTYRDIYSRKHCTEVNVQIRPVGDGSGLRNIETRDDQLQRHVKFSPVGPQNFMK